MDTSPLQAGQGSQSRAPSVAESYMTESVGSWQRVHHLSRHAGGPGLKGLTPGTSSPPHGVQLSPENSLFGLLHSWFAPVPKVANLRGSRSRRVTENKAGLGHLELQNVPPADIPLGELGSSYVHTSLAYSYGGSALSDLAITASSQGTSQRSSADGVQTPQVARTLPYGHRLTTQDAGPSTGLHSTSGHPAGLPPLAPMRPERALPTLSEVLDDPISHAQLLSAWTAEHARNCAAAAGLPPPTAGARVLAETAVQTDPLHQPTTSATCAQTDAPPRTASSSAQYEPHASAAAACQTDTRGLTSSSDCTAQTDAPAASTDAACSAMPALSTSAMQTDTPQPPPTTSTGCSAVPLVVRTEVQTDRSLVARTSVSGSTQTDPIVVSRAGVSVQTDTRTSCSGSTQTDTAAVATTGTMAAPQQVSVTVQVDVSQLVAHLAVQTQTDALVAPVTADAFTEPDHALTLDECDEMSESEEGEERQALQDTVLELQNENTLLAKTCKGHLTVVQQLQSVLAGLEACNSDLQQEQVASSEMIRDLQSQLQQQQAASNEAAHALQSQLQQQQAQSAAATQALQAQLQKQQAASSEAMSELQSQLDSQRGELDAAMSAVAASQAQAAELESQLAASQSQAATLQGQLAAAQAEHAGLQEQLTAREAHAAELQGQLAASQQRLVDLQGQLAASEQHAASLQEQLAASQQQLHELTAEHSAAELDAAADAAAASGSSQAAAAAAAARAARVAGQGETLQSKLHRLQLQLEQLQKEHAALHTQHARHLSRERELTLLNEQLQRQMGLLEPVQEDDSTLADTDPAGRPMLALRPQAAGAAGSTASAQQRRSPQHSANGGAVAGPTAVRNPTSPTTSAAGGVKVGGWRAAHANGGLDARQSLADRWQHRLHAVEAADRPAGAAAGQPEQAPRQFASLRATGGPANGPAGGVGTESLVDTLTVGSGISQHRAALLSLAQQGAFGALKPLVTDGSAQAGNGATRVPGRSSTSGSGAAAAAAAQPLSPSDTGAAAANSRLTLSNGGSSDCAPGYYGDAAAVASAAGGAGPAGLAAAQRLLLVDNQLAIEEEQRLTHSRTWESAMIVLTGTNTQGHTPMTPISHNLTLPHSAAGHVGHMDSNGDGWKPSLAVSDGLGYLDGANGLASNGPLSPDGTGDASDAVRWSPATPVKSSIQIHSNPLHTSEACPWE